MMKESRTASALRLLGLARRAGAVVPGVDSVRRAVRLGEARLIWMAEDASSVQLDKIRTTLRDRSIPRVILGDRHTLGDAVGMAALSAVAVTQASFADRIAEELEAHNGDRSADVVEA